MFILGRVGPHLVSSGTLLHCYTAIDTVFLLDTELITLLNLLLGDIIISIG